MLFYPWLVKHCQKASGAKKARYYRAAVQKIYLSEKFALTCDFIFSTVLASMDFSSYSLCRPSQNCTGSPKYSESLSAYSALILMRPLSIALKHTNDMPSPSATCFWVIFLGLINLETIISPGSSIFRESIFLRDGRPLLLFTTLCSILVFIGLNGFL